MTTQETKEELLLDIDNCLEDARELISEACAKASELENPELYNHLQATYRMLCMAMDIAASYFED